MSLGDHVMGEMNGTWEGSNYVRCGTSEYYRVIREREAESNRRDRENMEKRIKSEVLKEIQKDYDLVKKK